MRYVIVGNSTAAIGCIEGIRQIDRESEIVVISKEPYTVYSRPLISYLLCGETDRERMKYRPDDFYEKNGVTLLLGKCVVKVLDAEHKAVLDDGEEISYDKLLLATGSSPFIPPMEGLDSIENKFTFMSLDDALSLDKVLDQDKRVLIVGAGLIGLKCAEGIYEKVKSITVVDLADRVLSSILDADGSAMVQEHLEKKGITFHLSDCVEKFDKDTAYLKSGADVAFDIAVIAVGVRPNTQLAEGTEIKAERGFVTDLHCRTTAKDIYAAGDCAQSLDTTTGTQRVLALLPNAYMQGECAGIDMAGGEKPYDFAIPMNAIGFFGLHMVTAGSYEGETYVEKTEDSYKKLVTKDNRLVGYILIGQVKRAGIYTALIREKTPLDSIDFDKIKDHPQLMAFERQKRKKLLGGVPA